MFKKIFSIILTGIISIMVLGNVVSASEIAPMALYTYSSSSTLTISEATATCTSKATGYSGETTKIVISQVLQKKTSSGTWSSVSSWSETDTGYIGSATNKKSSLSNGTYRLKTVFTVYAGTNFEEITKYSTEKTI